MCGGAAGSWVCSIVFVWVVCAQDPWGPQISSTKLTNHSAELVALHGVRTSPTRDSPAAQQRVFCRPSLRGCCGCARCASQPASGLLRCFVCCPMWIAAGSFFCHLHLFFFHPPRPPFFFPLCSFPGQPFRDPSTFRQALVSP